VTSLLRRYQAGEHRAVWAEIGRGRWWRPAAGDEVEAVAAETMRRVARHVRRLAEAYRELGFVVSDPQLPMYRAATAEDVADLSRLDTEIGGLPVALRACLTEVGEVWLAGDCPALGLSYHREGAGDVLPDPLCLPSVSWLRDSWTEHLDDDPGRRFSFEFAPDELHKANISGATHEIRLPDRTADPRLRGAGHARRITLVDYLRKSIAWGGCPGWSAAPDRVPAALAGLRVEPDF
jgi:hypothetical protein